MKITAVETLHCDAGWRVFSYVKITTDQAGLIGWSEYNESYGSRGLTAVIGKLGERLVGRDPRAVERLYAELYAVTRQAPGGINQQAIAALENALLDVKAKALGVPVYELLGGPVRDRLRLYWSHCGTTRVSAHNYIDAPQVRSLEDVARLGAEARERGFQALKTNILMFDGEPRVYMPGFARRPDQPLELNPEREVIAALQAQLAAFREGAGPDMGLLLDLNFNLKTEGYRKVGRVLEPYDLFWLEIDSYEPRALAYIRQQVPMPVASCESLFGIRQFVPFFEHFAMDVCIIDAIWNGVLQSFKIAAMAEAYEVNVAPHNFYGHLSTLHSAHLMAAVPNFRIMEIDIDDVPWKDELVTYVPEIEDGHLKLPPGPGWGADINEDVVRRHPPKA